GGLASRHIRCRTNAADPRNRRRAFDAQDAAVAGSKNFRLVVGKNGPEPEEESSGTRTDLLDRTHSFYANGLVLIRKELDEVSEQLVLRQIAASDESKSTCPP